MIEHWFLAAMLAVVGLEAVVVCAMAYKVLRRSKRIAALTAATYLEARRSLGKPR